MHMPPIPTTDYYIDSDGVPSWKTEKHLLQDWYKWEYQNGNRAKAIKIMRVADRLQYNSDI